MTRPFTGWHMVAIMIGFFGLIVAVNVTMARFAVSSFGGVVVDNSYVASQRYNGWLQAAADQQALGWQVTPRIDADGRLHIVAHDASGQPINGRVIVVARHPLGRVPDQRIALRRTAVDHVAVQALQRGRWLLHIELTAVGHVARFEDEVHG